MRVKYKTKNGIINTFIGYFDVSVMENGGKEVSRHEIMENIKTKSRYFVYNDEEIDLFSFEYTPIDELIEKISNHRADNEIFISDDEVIATFIKEADKVAIKMNVSLLENYFGIVFISSDPDHKCFMIPDEYRFKKDQWYYKIDLKPLYNEYDKVVSRETYYSCDLIRCILDGHYDLYNREKLSDEEIKFLEKEKN